jgi:hypothetical protein
MVKFAKIANIVIINQNTSCLDFLKDQQIIKLDWTTNTVIQNQNTWFRLFQGPYDHKIGPNCKHINTKWKHMV